MYPRDWRDICAPVTETIRTIGMHVATEAVGGLSESLLEKWQCPTAKDKPSIERCVALDAAYERVTGKRGLIIEWYMERLGQLESQDVGHAEIEVIALDLGILLGRLLEEVKTATHTDSPGGVSFTAHEKARVLKVKSMLVRMLSRLEAFISANSIE